MNATYWKSLLAAVLGGAAAGVTQASQSSTSLKATGIAAAVGGVGTAIAYVLQSPLKPKAPADTPAK